MKEENRTILWLMVAIAILCLLMLMAERSRSATYTYTESNATGIAAATSCGGVSTADQNFVLTRGTPTTGTITVGTLGPGANELETFTGAASDPGLTSWDAGNWVVGINVSTANANIQWTATCVFQLNSGGTLVNTVGTLTGQTTSMGSTGLKTHTVSGSAESPSATDRIQVVTVFHSTAAHGNNNFSFTIGTTANSETVATPIVVPAATSQVIMISRLILGME